MFYGWRVVTGTFIAQLFVVGFFTYAASLFVAPVREAFDASLEQVMYSFTFATLLGLFVTPLAGIALDRYPVRWLIAGAAVLFAAGLWGLSISTSIWQYVIVFGLTMAVVNALGGSMSASAVIARWFTASRGKALGIAAIGTSFGGIVLPRLLGDGITALGWRESLQYLAVVVILVMLPLVILLVRGRPEDVGLAPEEGAEAPADAPVQQTLSTADILGHRGFWFMSLSLGLLFSAYSSVLANLGPYALNLGHDQSAASMLIIVVAICGLIGKLVFGAMADKINLKLGLFIAQALVFIGLLLLALEPSYAIIVCGTISLGLAAGGMLPVWGALTARIFGLLSFGRVMGMTGPIITLCILPGFAIVGRLYDTSGSYAQALQLFAGVMVVSALLLAPLRLDHPPGSSD